MSLKEFLKEEFDGFKPSGIASDLMNSKNILSRDIIGIISDADVIHMSINIGNKGKFVWMNKADGTTLSGNIENDDIWRDFPLIGFDKVNYNMIEFALIPVDDFTVHKRRTKYDCWEDNNMEYDNMEKDFYLSDFIDELDISDDIEICIEDIIEDNEKIKIGYINNAEEADDSVGYYYDGSTELEDFKNNLSNIFKKPISHEIDVDVDYGEWDYWIARSGYLIIPK